MTELGKPDGARTRAALEEHDQLSEAENVPMRMSSIRRANRFGVLADGKERGKAAPRRCSWR
jgi:hypothetical protein